MSDDNDNVIEGVFGGKEYPPSASDMFQMFADAYDGEEAVEAVVLVHKEGEPTVLAGNVNLDVASMLLLMGQQALIEQVYGGGDVTTH